MASRWSSVRPSVRFVRFRTMSKFQWLVTNIVETEFGIANEQISSIMTELSARHTSVVSFPDNNLS